MCIPYIVVYAVSNYIYYNFISMAIFFNKHTINLNINNPDSKDEPHVGPMNLAIKDVYLLVKHDFMGLETSTIYITYTIIILPIAGYIYDFVILWVRSRSGVIYNTPC